MILILQNPQRTTKSHIAYLFSIYVFFKLQINDLVKLCGPFIELLEIRSLIPCDLISKRSVSPEMASFVSIKNDTVNDSQNRSSEPIVRGQFVFNYELIIHKAFGI